MRAAAIGLHVPLETHRQTMSVGAIAGVVVVVIVHVAAKVVGATELARVGGKFVQLRLQRRQQ